MRTQVRAAMIYNGHTATSIDAIDEETFAEICVMYADGLLGVRSTYEALTPLTTAVFNYMRKDGAPPYKATQIFPWVIEYDQNPDLEADKVQDGLFAFMSQAPGFNMGIFNGNSVQLQD